MEIFFPHALVRFVHTLCSYHIRSILRCGYKKFHACVPEVTNWVIEDRYQCCFLLLVSQGIVLSRPVTVVITPGPGVKRRSVSI